jgi:CBS domain-containing protein
MPTSTAHTRIAEVMTRSPKTIGSDALAVEAAQLMEAHKIGGLLVIDADAAWSARSTFMTCCAPGGLKPARRPTLPRVAHTATPGSMPYSHLNDYPADIRERAARVRLACFDVDGTLTDGGCSSTAKGVELKAFHVHDGQGLVLLRKSGSRWPSSPRAPARSPSSARPNSASRAHTAVKDKLACVQDIARGWASAWTKSPSWATTCPTCA